MQTFFLTGMPVSIYFCGKKFTSDKGKLYGSMPTVKQQLSCKKLLSEISVRMKKLTWIVTITLCWGSIILTAVLGGAKEESF